MKNKKSDLGLSIEETGIKFYTGVKPKVRKCRVCAVDLPPQYYFHCKPCRDKIESEESSDDSI